LQIIQEVEKYNAKIKDAERASKNLKKIYSQCECSLHNSRDLEYIKIMA